MGYWSAKPRFASRGRRLLGTWTVTAVLALAPATAPGLGIEPGTDAVPGVQPGTPSGAPSGTPSGAPSLPPASPSAAPPPSALPRITPLKPSDDPCVEPSTSVVDQAPWTHNSLGVSDVHRLNRGEGVTVAVLATAVEGDVPALSGAVQGAGTDCLGFGTFLAGIVAARALPGSGFVGIAPEAEVVAIPTGDADTGITSAAQIASSINDAVAADADVILVGTAAWSGSTALDEAVGAAVDAGALVVAPATAIGQNGQLPGYPAQDPAVLSVASHQTTGETMLTEPLFTADEELARIDVEAPGDRVMGVGPGGDGHFTSTGDGAAAAFAAGAAALIRSGEPDLTGAQVRERLLTTAYTSPYGAEDPFSGHGKIDLMGALTNSPGGASDLVPGERFVPDPSTRGSVEMASTVAVSSVSGAVVVLCVLAGLVIRRGRPRRWRPAVPGEPITPETPPANPLSSPPPSKP